MIQLEHVSFRYAEMETKALENISLQVDRGKCVVLSGSSGCGKTTITRLINGLIPSFYPGELSGTVKIAGEDIAGLEPHELATKIGSVFQNPRTQFFNTDTDSEIVFGMENCGISYEEMHDRYEQTEFGKFVRERYFCTFRWRETANCIWKYIRSISRNICFGRAVGKFGQDCNFETSKPAFAVKEQWKDFVDF